MEILAPPDDERLRCWVITGRHQMLGGDWTPGSPCKLSWRLSTFCKMYEVRQTGCIRLICFQIYYLWFYDFRTTLLANLINASLVQYLDSLFREVQVYLISMNFTEHEHGQPTAGCGIFCIFPWLAGFGRSILYNSVILCWCHLCKYKLDTLRLYSFQFNLTITRDTWQPSAAANGQHYE